MATTSSGPDSAFVPISTIGASLRRKAESRYCWTVSLDHELVGADCVRHLTCRVLKKSRVWL
jgi:hypothetical protein